nr:PREDICTED: uncharacterized protein LOC103970877 [Musa acuminata subsp. malaccensis]
MDPRLEEAAYAGDLTLLRRLLQEDRLLLHRQAIAAAHLSDSPLHIAASLGHSDLVREILAVNPELAHGRNSEGLSALHLGAAQGHLSVVNELLQYAAAANLCLATDNDGLMPAHTAALRGRLDVLTVLLDACPESARAVTSQGDSILHLTVKSNSFETVQFLLNRTDENDELLNSGDAKGNTVLHLAVARKQLQTVKLLLGRRGIEVNATNMRGDTVLDMLLDSPCQHGDLLLGDLIRAAGGRTAAKEERKTQPKSSPSDARASATVASHRSRPNRSERKEKYNNKPEALMVVATLIATITFQAGLTPPGGFKQKDDGGPTPPNAEVNFDGSSSEGEAVLKDGLKLFLLFDMFALFASLSIILLLICCVPTQTKMMTGTLKWILWLAVFSTALAFSTAIMRIFPYQLDTVILLMSWLGILSLFMVWVCIRAIRWLLRKGGCWKKKDGEGGSHGGPRRAVAIGAKIVVGVLIIIIFGVVLIVNYLVFVYVANRSNNLSMDPRLEEAAYAGDLTLLRRLLREDRLLLHRQAIAAAHLSDSPLHIAASLGHSDLVREILAVNPELAHGRNREGLSALHLAAAQGHLSVVNELLQYAAAANLCLATDNDSFMPAHTAALRGRLDVLTVLLDACPESLRAVTSQGDSILHLTVKSNSFETVQFLLNRTDENDELLNSGDAKGNTVLHLAVARKQLQTVKLLLGRRGIEVNATNMRGDTVLDMLLDSPCQLGDLLLGELIRAAGGRTTAEEGKTRPKSSPGDARASATVASHRSRPNRSEPKEKYNNKPATLMLVATLIATITFAAGLNPPGGFKQKDDGGSTPPIAEVNFDESSSEGEAVLKDDLELFLLFDMFGLFASLSIILLLICCVPRQTKMVMGILKWILWLAVFSTALAFSTAIVRIFSYQLYTVILLMSWFGILSLFMIWVCFRAIRGLLRKGGCWKKKDGEGESQGVPTRAVAIRTKIVVGALMIIIFGVVLIVNYLVFVYILNMPNNRII